MAKGYVILTEDIHDADAMARYAALSTPVLREFGGKALAVEPDVDVLEGTWHGNRTVVIEFESVERARQWYDSDAYQHSLPLRRAAADCSVVIIGGLTPPDGADPGAAR